MNLRSDRARRRAARLRTIRLILLLILILILAGAGFLIYSAVNKGEPGSALLFSQVSWWIETIASAGLA